MTSSRATRIDLRSAAAELGVHYQTAYRWVRTGKLESEVVNGRYQVARSDLEALQRARTTPSGRRAPSGKRLERAATRMHTALEAGDEATARQIARTLVDEGTRVTELVQAVLVPSLCAIGQDWHDGKLSIWVEHRASAITERLLGEIATNPRGRRRGTAMVAAVAGDHHSLPTTMAAVAMRDDQWHVHHLGANMPGDELVRFCAEHGIDVAVLTLTNPDVEQLATSTARAIEANGTPTLVGAPGRTLDELLEQARSTPSGPDRDA